MFKNYQRLYVQKVLIKFSEQNIIWKLLETATVRQGYPIAWHTDLTLILIQHIYTRISEFILNTVCYIYNSLGKFVDV